MHFDQPMLKAKNLLLLNTHIIRWYYSYMLILIRAAIPNRYKKREFSNRPAAFKDSVNPATPILLDRNYTAGRRAMARPNFRYTHYDLKELRAGTVIEVSLSAVNNVRLMTGANFQRFTELLDFKYLGGVAKKSPIRLAIPETLHWHLVIDAEGHSGLAESSVKMLPAQPQAAPHRKAS
jgi:hypothetical protein